MLEMGDYCAPGRGVSEITPPEGPIMPPRGLHYAAPRAVSDRRSRQPEGGIMQPEGSIMGPEGGIISVTPSSGAQ